MTDKSESLAAATFGRVASHARYPAHVHADRGQDSAGAQPQDEPLVGSAFLPDAREASPLLPSPTARKLLKSYLILSNIKVLIETSAGATKTVPLAPRPVADFYARAHVATAISGHYR